MNEPTSKCLFPPSYVHLHYSAGKQAGKQPAVLQKQSVKLLRVTENRGGYEYLFLVKLCAFFDSLILG